MSMLGRAAGGFGSSVASIANRYLDEQFAEQRAQVLADISRVSQVRTAGELDAQARDPGRLESIRREKAADISSDSEAKDAAALRTLQNGALTQAQIDQKLAELQGVGPALAEQAGLLERAREREKPIRTNPGDEVYDSSGKLIVRNTQMTAGELQLQALREGLKGRKVEERQRYYEEVLRSTDKQLEEISKRISEGTTNGTLKTVPPDPKTHWFSPDEPGKDPAYDAWQELKARQNSLEKARNTIIGEMKAAHESGRTSGAAPAAGGVREPRGSTRTLPGDSDAPAIWQRAAAELKRNIEDARERGDTEAVNRNERDLAELVAEAARSKVQLNLDAAAAPPPSGRDPLGLFPGGPAAPASAASAPKPLAERAAERSGVETAVRSFFDRAMGTPAPAAAPAAGTTSSGLRRQDVDEIKNQLRQRYADNPAGLEGEWQRSTSPYVRQAILELREELAPR